MGDKRDRKDTSKLGWASMLSAGSYAGVYD